MAKGRITKSEFFALVERMTAATVYWIRPEERLIVPLGTIAVDELLALLKADGSGPRIVPAHALDPSCPRFAVKLQIDDQVKAIDIWRHGIHLMFGGYGWLPFIDNPLWTRLKVMRDAVKV